MPISNKLREQLTARFALIGFDPAALSSRPAVPRNDFLAGHAVLIVINRGGICPCCDLPMTASAALVRNEQMPPALRKLLTGRARRRTKDT